MSKLKIFIVISLISLSLSDLAFGQTMNREQIQDFVVKFIENNIPLPEQGKMTVSVSSIDPRIIIKPCLSSLLANIPQNHNGRNVNVKINCNDPTPWYLFIPAKIQMAFIFLISSLNFLFLNSSGDIFLKLCS